MTRSLAKVSIVGGGLAGCEAALQLAGRGIPVRLIEMRPEFSTPAHRGGKLAEIVCSNSLKSTAEATPSGLLKQELALLGCHLLKLARKASVPAGAALAVDKDEFSNLVEAAISAEPWIEVVRDRVLDLPRTADHLWLLATGPLTGEELASKLSEISGRPALHFYDAIAPTVTIESLDMDKMFRAARYDKGDADYLNAGLDLEQYTSFCKELVNAQRADVQEFEKGDLFSGCQPVEEIATSGPQSLSFGPLRPVGLHNPKTGIRPHGVVQLRQENKDGTLFGLVGFQTRLKFGEQKRIFRMIPGLENAEFVRYGQLHRNFYLDTPRCLNPDFSLARRPDVFIAGQITGVEGYVESIASGLFSALQVACRIEGSKQPDLPPETMMGSLIGGFLFDRTSERFSPMNANFGLLPDLAERVRGKRERKLAKSSRAIQALRAWLDIGSNTIQHD